MQSYVYDTICNNPYRYCVENIDDNFCKIMNMVITKTEVSETNSYIDKIKEFIDIYFVLCIDNIKKFFSSADVVTDIREIYSNMGKPHIMQKEVRGRDMNLALSLYTEYLEGLDDFIYITKGVQSEEVNLVKMYKKISHIMVNDAKFTYDIFYGNKNKPVKESISEAMKQVELLIDFIPNIENYLDKCKKNVWYISEMNTLSLNKINTMNIYVRSVMHFVDRFICEITELFFNICLVYKDNPLTRDNIVKEFAIL